MLNIGWTELMIIGIVALIVIGPKDLPEMFRTLGRFTAKARGMAREFQRAMESAADEAGVKDVAKDLKSMTSAKSMGLDAVKGAASKFENWDPLKKSKPAVPPVDKAVPAAAEPAKPLGAATQKLLDEQAAKRAARAQSAATKAQAAAPSPEPVRAPAAKASAAKMPAPKTSAIKKPAIKKPAIKKSDA